MPGTNSFCWVHVWVRFLDLDMSGSTPGLGCMSGVKFLFPMHAWSRVLGLDNLIPSLSMLFLWLDKAFSDIQAWCMAVDGVRQVLFSTWHWSEYWVWSCLIKLLSLHHPLVSALLPIPAQVCTSVSVHAQRRCYLDDLAFTSPGTCLEFHRLLASSRDVYTSLYIQQRPFYFRRRHKWNELSSSRHKTETCHQMRKES